MSNTLWVSPNGVTVSQDTAVSDCNVCASSLINHAENTPIDHPDLSVSEEKIAPDAVGCDKIKNGAVTNEKIADASVTSKKIVSGAVTQEKIAQNAVTTTKIADKSVTADKLSDSAVTSDKIANASITTAKLADKSITQDKLCDYIMTKDNFADSSVISSKLAPKSVTSAKIADGAVTQDKIADSAVTENKIANASITCDKLADKSVTQSKLDTSSVNTDNICDGAVTSDKLATGSVCSDKIAADTIRGEHIAMNTITTANLEDNCVTVCELADNSVSEDKLCEGSVTKSKLSSEVLDSVLMHDNGKITDDVSFLGKTKVNDLKSDLLSTDSKRLIVDCKTKVNDTIYLSGDIYIGQKKTASPMVFVSDTIAESKIDLVSIKAKPNSSQNPFIDIHVTGKNIFGYTRLADRIQELFSDSILTDDDITFTPDNDSIILSDCFQIGVVYTIILAAGMEYTSEDTGFTIVYSGGREVDLTFTDGLCTYYTNGIIECIKTHQTAEPVTLDYNTSGIYYGKVTLDDFEDCICNSYRINLIDENNNTMAPLRAINSYNCDKIIPVGTTFYVERMVAKDGSLLDTPYYEKLADSVCDTLRNMVTPCTSTHFYVQSDMNCTSTFTTYSSLLSKLSRIPKSTEL